MPDIIHNTQPRDEELGFQTKIITSVLKITILGAALFLANSLFLYWRNSQLPFLIAIFIGLALLLVGFSSMRLVKQGKLVLAKRIFLFAYFLRSIQLLLFIPESLFPIAAMYLIVFVIVSIFISEPKKGFHWLGLGAATMIAAIPIRHITHLSVLEIKDPTTYYLAIYFLPLVCLGIISTLCVYVFREFHKTLLESLNARRRLKHSNKSLENFAHVAAHDLQAPLRSITSYAQLLDRDYQEKLDHDGNERIQAIIANAKQMQGLVKDLLRYSQLKTQKISFESTNLNEAMVQVLKNLQSNIQESGAIITVGDLPTISAYPSQMAQLFQNLIENAISFRSPQNPQIEVSAMLLDKHYVFSVKDNGIGIRKEDSEKIFHIFQRLNNQNEYPGNGIGLAIVQEIVIAHSGQIWVKSEPDKGSTFFFTLSNH